MLRAIASLAISFAGMLYGQPAADPQFEVASVKLANPGPNFSSGIATGHGRLHASNVTLKRCIIGAYNVVPQQVSGGPDWLDSDRFEILAKADGPLNDDAVFMAMLRSLLAERFKLALHRETRTIQALVLEVGKNGPKLDKGGLEKAGEGESTTNTSNTRTGALIDARYTSMDIFARVLGRTTDLPVINQTGLEGSFNFKLSWTPDRAGPANANADGPSLPTAIQEQLGLHLAARKVPVEILVIDHAEKPSEN